jgi:hypothetical protein
MKIEINVQTGELKNIPLTQAEIDYNAAESAKEAAENTPDAIANRVVSRGDTLNFAINFDQENRIRTLEGRPQITRAQYFNALVNVFKGL